MNRLGSGYLGSSSIEYSSTNHEVVPNNPDNWNRGYKFYKFNFINHDSCTVVINKDSDNPDLP